MNTINRRVRNNSKFIFKRLIDLVFSIIILIILLPLFVLVLILIWIQDFSSPIYVSKRVGKNGKPFKLIKMRSMIKNASTSGVDSTASNDKRITPIGKIIREYKLDELTQLINVLLGQMSLVGPRPNVLRETEMYTNEERTILSIKPGITDIASIVFSDEGAILDGKPDPDLSYNQLIRPWKSRLAILYSEKFTIRLDIILIFTTVISIFSKDKALKIIVRLLKSLQAENSLINVASRKNILVPYPPPGSDKIVISRLIENI